MKKTKTIIDGKVRDNIYGNWSNVDRGQWIGGEHFAWAYPMGVSTILDALGLNGRTVRITIEEIDSEEE